MRHLGPPHFSISFKDGSEIRSLWLQPQARYFRNDHWSLLILILFCYFSTSALRVCVPTVVATQRSCVATAVATQRSCVATAVATQRSCVANASDSQRLCRLCVANTIATQRLCRLCVANAFATQRLCAACASQTRSRHKDFALQAP